MNNSLVFDYIPLPSVDLRKLRAQRSQHIHDLLSPTQTYLYRQLQRQEKKGFMKAVNIPSSSTSATDLSNGTTPVARLGK